MGKHLVTSASTRHVIGIVMQAAGKVNIENDIRLLLFDRTRFYTAQTKPFFVLLKSIEKSALFPTPEIFPLTKL